jgi:hypothetical protein
MLILVLQFLALSLIPGPPILKNTDFPSVDSIADPDIDVENVFAD